MNRSCYNCCHRRINIIDHNSSWCKKLKRKITGSQWGLYCKGYKEKPKCIQYLEGKLNGLL